MTIQREYYRIIRIYLIIQCEYYRMIRIYLIRVS